MHPDMVKLMGLQALDLEAKRLRDEIAALPRQVGTLETKAKATAGQRAVVLDLIAREEALRRRQESDIADLQQKRQRGRVKLDGATSTAQVTALEHELEFCRQGSGATRGSGVGIDGAKRAAGGAKDRRRRGARRGRRCLSAGARTGGGHTGPQTTPRWPMWTPRRGSTARHGVRGCTRSLCPDRTYARNGHCGGA